MGNVKIECLSPAHSWAIFQQIARLHVQEIHHGLLPLLGLRFMTRLYFEMARAPRTGVWAALERTDDNSSSGANSSVMGFVAGCADVRATYRWMLLLRGFLFGFLALRGLLSFTVLSKLPSLFLYPFRVNKSLGEAQTDPSHVEERPPDAHAQAELLAIAVDARAQRRGLGFRLLAAMEQGMRDWGVRGEYHVTTNTQEVASNSFYLKAGFQPAGTLRHHDLILQRYAKDVPEASLNREPVS